MVQYFIVSKRNPFTLKHYRLSLDDFDEPIIHDNDVIPQIIDPYVCGYCQKHFTSRNKLFNHLGFMGIDIWSEAKVYYNDKKKINKKRYGKQTLDQIFKKIKIT